MTRRLPATVRLSGRDYTVPITAVDRVVNWFSPAAGAERFRGRMAMAVAGWSGGYTGADRSRRANQSGSRREMDADSAIVPDLIALREDSQHLVRNNAIAGGAISTNITKVVGTGLKLKSQIDRATLDLSDEAADAWERQAELEFRLATETREIDAERSLPFSLFQALVLQKVLEDGDLFVNLVRRARPGSPYRLQLQGIEAARVCNPGFAPDRDRLVAGVEKDSGGAPVRYHVLNRHPGNFRSAVAGRQYSWQALDAFGRSGRPLVLHLLDKKRFGQTRGVPYMAPVVELIKQLGRYTDAEVMAAVVSGFLSVFVTNESGNPGIGPAATASNPSGDASLQTDSTGMELGYGTVVGLMPGEKIETVSPGRPNVAFDPFVMAIMRQIGMALEIPYELLVKHFTASYSAARASLEEAWDYFSRRRHWLATQFCQPIYEAVLDEAVAAGRIAAPGYFADPLVRAAWLGSSWIGDAASQLDPVKEIEAATRRVELTVSTIDEESRRLTGTPWEDKLPQILKERVILRQHQIAVTAGERERLQAAGQSAQAASGTDTEDERHATA